MFASLQLCFTSPNLAGFLTLSGVETNLLTLLADDCP